MTDLREVTVPVVWHRSPDRWTANPELEIFRFTALCDPHGAGRWQIGLIRPDAPLPPITLRQASTLVAVLKEQYQEALGGEVLRFFSDIIQGLEPKEEEL
jgi:hypothetical protein